MKNRFLTAKESEILGLLADNPKKYYDLLKLLKGEALKIGEGIVYGTNDPNLLETVNAAFDWAYQPRKMKKLK